MHLPSNEVNYPESCFHHSGHRMIGSFTRRRPCRTRLPLHLHHGVCLIRTPLIGVPRLVVHGTNATSVSAFVCKKSAENRTMPFASVNVRRACGLANGCTTCGGVSVHFPESVVTPPPTVEAI